MATAVAVTPILCAQNPSAKVYVLTDGLRAGFFTVFIKVIKCDCLSEVTPIRSKFNTGVKVKLVETKLAMNNEAIASLTRLNLRYHLLETILCPKSLHMGYT